MSLSAEVCANQANQIMLQQNHELNKQKRLPKSTKISSTQRFSDIFIYSQTAIRFSAEKTRSLQTADDHNITNKPNKSMSI